MMVKPQEIKKKADAKYPAFCRAFLKNEDFFPLTIPCNKGKSTDPFLERKKAMERLVNQSDERKKYSYSIEWGKVKTLKYGMQSIVKRIYFKDKISFLKYIGLQKLFDNLSINVSYIRNNLAELEKWLPKNILFLQKEPSLWPDLITVCKWFMENPDADIYLREIPLNIHTKFIEENKKVLRSLLDFLLPDHRINSSTSNFARRYGLKWDEPMVRYRYHLDEEIENTALPLGLFKEKELSGEMVFIIENKTNFLTFPLEEGMIAVWGKGFGAIGLADVPWFFKHTLVYWGDLDPSGFEILSRFRSFYPAVESFLMDFKTYKEFQKFAVVNPVPNSGPLENLRTEEQEVYDYLLAHPLQGRLEQERINQIYVQEALEDWITANHPY